MRGRVAILLAACVVSPAAARGEIDAGQMLAGFQAWLDGTRDLSGRFVQRMVSGALGDGLEESGRLYLQRPGRMRWDYLEPETKVALVTGDRTLLYLEEDRQLWEGTLDEADSLLPALLAGTRPLRELFDVTVAPSPAGTDRDAYRLSLAPRGPESFQEILLTLRPPSFAIREVEVLDSAGNRMLYRFSRLERNAGLSDAAFHFDPPPGTEILLQSQAP